MPAVTDLPSGDEGVLLCPMCDYDLRAQIEPRCPECGYVYVPEELRDPARRLHPYLFEHHPERNLVSFGRTVIGGWRPKRFWTQLQPTQPSRPGRLAAYFMIIMLVGILPLAAEAVQAYLSTLADIRTTRAMMLGYYSSNKNGSAILRLRFPGLTAAQAAAQYAANYTWKDYAREMARRMQIGRTMMLLLPQLVWPWLTMATLMIFRISMRRARVKPIHVMRCVIYSADVLFPASIVLGGVLIGAGWLYLQGVTGDPHNGSIPVVAACLMLVMFLIFAYRLTAALRLYLRFDHPRSTVFATQLIVFLVLTNFVVAAAWM